MSTHFLSLRWPSSPRPGPHHPSEPFHPRIHNSRITGSESPTLPSTSHLLQLFFILKGPLSSCPLCSLPVPSLPCTAPHHTGLILRKELHGEGVTVPMALGLGGSQPALVRQGGAEGTASQCPAGGSLDHIQPEARGKGVLWCSPRNVHCRGVKW